MRSSSSVLGTCRSSQTIVHTGAFADLLVKSAVYTDYIAFEYRAGTEQLDGIFYVVSTGTALKGNKLERDLLAEEREVNCTSSLHF